MALCTLSFTFSCDKIYFLSVFFKKTKPVADLKDRELVHHLHILDAKTELKNYVQMEFKKDAVFYLRMSDIIACLMFLFV